MRPLLVTISLLLLFSACRKEKTNNYPNHSIALNRTVADNGQSIFSWTEVNTDDFIAYELYGSNSPINEVDQAGSLANVQKIVTISDRKRFSFKDSLDIGSRLKYFKVLARLENSILSSAQITNDDIQFIETDLNLGINLFPQPEAGIIIIIQGSSNVSKASIYDYKNQNFLIKDKALTGGTNNFREGIYQNKLVFYYLNYPTLQIYDADNFNPLATITLSMPNAPSAAWAVFLKNDYLGMRTYSGGIYRFANYNLTNASIDSLNGEIAAQLFYCRAYNPSFLYYYSNARDSIRYYNIDASGKATNASYIKYNQQSLFTEANITKGSKEYFADQTGKIFDRDFNLINNFTLDPSIFNLNFLNNSPNVRYYAYQFNNGLKRSLEIYEDGTTELYKRISTPPNINFLSVFLDNTTIYTMNTEIIDGKNGLLINKIDLE